MWNFTTHLHPFILQIDTFDHKNIRAVVVKRLSKIVLNQLQFYLELLLQYKIHTFSEFKDLATLWNNESVRVAKNVFSSAAKMRHQSSLFKILITKLIFLQFSLLVINYFSYLSQQNITYKKILPCQLYSFENHHSFFFHFRSSELVWRRRTFRSSGRLNTSRKGTIVFCQWRPSWFRNLYPTSEHWPWQRIRKRPMDVSTIGANLWSSSIEGLRFGRIHSSPQIWKNQITANQRSIRICLPRITTI